MSRSSRSSLFSRSNDLCSADDPNSADILSIYHELTSLPNQLDLNVLQHPLGSYSDPQEQQWLTNMSTLQIPLYHYTPDVFNMATNLLAPTWRLALAAEVVYQHTGHSMTSSNATQ